MTSPISTHWRALLALAALSCSQDERPSPTTPQPSGAGNEAPPPAAGPLRRHNEAPSKFHRLNADRTIADENQLPGTTWWGLDDPAFKHEVEGYASAVSAIAGQTITLHVNVDQAKLVRWELFRMGYYQGLGGRLVESSAEKQVQPQEVCPADPESGLVECNWEPAWEVAIQPSWITGQFFFKLIADGKDSFVPLVVREVVPEAQVLFQSSITTWQAYNLYGGSSLYRNNLPAGLMFSRAHADAVSFNRPYGCESDDGSCKPGLGNFDQGERWMGRFLEQRGIDVSYATTVDVAMDPSLLDKRKLFMSVGHDEYWPVSERDALERARDQGLSLAFITANAGYWRIRLEASSQGVPGRTVICYKEGARDPVQGPETTDEFRSEPHARPEDSLIGIMYDDRILRTYFDGFAQVVRDERHWIYEGTGVRNGDHLSHVTGREWDRLISRERSHPSLEIVAHANVLNVYGVPLSADVSVYYPTPESFVFAAGSLVWANGLGQPGYEDARIQRMTENVLARAGVTTFEMTEVARNERPEPPNRVWTMAGNGNPGFSDGSVLSAEFDSPTGVAAGEAGEIYVTDSSRHFIRVIWPDGKVTTLAGCGGKGRFQDGQGSGACFDNPTGIARAADGSFYIADTHNQRIRMITSSGHVTTIAGTGHKGRVDAPDPLLASFSYPRGIAFGPDGALYIAEGGTGLIRKLDKSGVSTVSEVVHPTGIAVGPDNTLYVVDARDATIVSIKDGKKAVIAGQPGKFGNSDGPALDARLRPSEGIFVDGDRLVFADMANHKIRALSLSDGMVSTVAGSHGTTEELELPRFLVKTPQGIVVADSGHHRVAIIRGD